MPPYDKFDIFDEYSFHMHAWSSFNILFQLLYVFHF